MKAVSIVKIVGLAIIVNVGKTTTEILTLKGAIAVLASEIAELQGYIAEANEAMEKATKIREKENSDYQQEKAFTETALSSLHAAIEVGGKNRSAYDRRTCSAASVSMCMVMVLL